MIKRIHLYGLFLLLITVALSGCETTSPHPNNQVEVVKSPNDDREYANLTLPNGMQVLLISDPTSEVATASLAVGVGSDQNPESQPGLAHYLEHMLFLGTENYPEPNSLQKYVEENAGFANAYTASDHTAYYFQIAADRIDPALDRFSDYFKAPTFDPEYSDKELRAINSEWSMGRNQDGRIIYRIHGLTANPMHPSQRISVGNLETLRDKPDSILYQEMKDFYAEYYSANLMNLVVGGRQSLEELESLTKKHFSDIPNSGTPRPTVNVRGITESEAGLHIYYTPQQDLKQLMVSYPINNNADNWRVKPNQYLANLISSEEPGTLASKLREGGLISSLTVNFQEDLYGADGLFNVVIELTNDGLEERDQVIASVFAFVDLVRREGVAEPYYGELKAILDQRFRDHENQPLLRQAVQISQRLFDYPPESVLSASYRYDHFDPQAINDVLAQLTPERARIWHITQQEETDQEIPFYKGSYRTAKVTPEELTHWQALADVMAFSLPEENPLFADYEVQIMENIYPKPTLIISRPGAEAWLSHSQHYPGQRGLFRLEINSDIGAQGARSFILASLLNDLFSLDTLPLQDRARRANIGIDIDRSPNNSQQITLTGYSARHDDLLEQLVASLVELEFDQRDFDNVKERFRVWQTNLKREEPYQQLFQHVRKINGDIDWSTDEVLAVLESVQLEDVREYQQQLLSKNLLRVYAFGNYMDATVTAMVERAENLLGPSRKPGERNLKQYITPSSGQTVVVSEDIEQGDTAILDGYIHPKQSIEVYARLNLLNGIMGNALYTQLRTQEQLGYVVGSSPGVVNEYPVFVIFVQSSDTDLVSIKDRLDKFRQEYAAQLENLDDAVLEQLRASVVAQLTQKPDNLNAEAGHYLNDFHDGNFEFDSRERLIAAIGNVSKEDLIETYQTLLLDQNATRLLIQLRGTRFLETDFAVPE